ncbi:MAG: GxxExxY protein [Candidatus Marinimicrobia bacterium]|nr:GxxExxY protein [Candidatus Neomarinimicrobiota bacterium]MCK4446182.1 GxxExxY protein [Candidatus Neomarinimicrobiota bacterium]
MLEKKYIADFVCYEKIIVETKALSALNTDHEAQLLNYFSKGIPMGKSNKFSIRYISKLRRAKTKL